jgi:serine/threonine-protein kinase
LLHRFKTPITLAHAICDYAAEMGLDPLKVVGDAADVFARLQSASVLITPLDAAAWGPAEPSLAPGQEVGDWRIVKCLQAYADSEVYCVRSAQGRFGALKIEGLHADVRDRNRLRAESKLIAGLQISCAPALLDEVAASHRFGIVLEWLDGGTGDRVASDLRVTGQAAVQRLAANITDAYVQLHARGYLHGDVHPANILIGENGRVHLIDFGEAICLFDQSGPGTYGCRGAVSQYLEPEAVADRLAGKVRFPSALGEQYSLAAVLYYLLTGTFHIPRLIDPKTWYPSVSGPILSSSVLPPNLEKVLRRALAVDPTQRYPSIASFAEEFRCVSESSASESRQREFSQIPPLEHYAAIPSNSLNDFSTAYIEKYLRFGKNTPTLPTNAPANSVYCGGAGVALACLRFAFLRADAELLASADLLTTRSTKAYLSGDQQWSAGINPSTVDSVSLFHGGPGIHLAAALASDCLGDAAGRRNAVEAFIESSMGKWRSPDLTMGRAGALLGAVILLRSFDSDADSEKVILSRTGGILHGELETWLVSLKPIGQDDRFNFLGIAHGWAGVLLAMMEWCNETRQVAPASLKVRLQELADLSVTRAAGIAWPRRGTGGTDLLSGWCHGSAGYVSLWLSAWRLYHDSEFLELALRSGLEAYTSEIFPISDVCCGYAGRSWSLLELARATGETVWIDRARELAMRAIQLSEPDHQVLSLFKGVLGVALLSSELGDPHYAAFPLGREWWV